MIQEFANYLKALRGYSDNTVSAYTSDIKEFARWIQLNHSDERWSTISRHIIDEYVTHLYNLGLAASSTNRKLSSIAALYNYMMRENLLDENPVKYESRRKQPKTIPATIPVAAIQKAYEHARGVKKTMLGLLASTGIRLQEMLDLRWEDINFSTCEILINGKGSKQRIVVSCQEVLADLKYMADTLPVQGRIFYQSQRTTRQIIWDCIRPFTRASKISPHVIRHTFATQLAKQGENIATIAKILGHERIETSQKYINMVEIPRPNGGLLFTTHYKS